MQYDFQSNLSVKGICWNKNSGKRILQYAVGALLYSPATREDVSDIVINKTIKDLKSFSLCLEDTILDDKVEYAESILIDNISKIYEALQDDKILIDDLPLIFIRVRNSEQILRLLKSFGNSSKVITGFILPKFNSSNLEKYIEAFNTILNDNIYIMPIIESENVINIQTRIEELIKIKNSIDCISKQVLNVRVGGNDFCNHFGFRRNLHSSIYDINVIASVLSDIMNVFGKDYVISAPVWEYFYSKGNQTQWIHGLNAELKLDKLNGFIGKTAIHPSQLPIIQQSMIVDYNDYIDANKILEWNNNILGVQKGTDGRMNEIKVHKKWAEKISDMAKIYGVKNL